MNKLYDIDLTDYTGLLDWVEGTLASGTDRVSTLLVGEPFNPKASVRQKGLWQREHFGNTSQMFLRPLIHPDQDVELRVESVKHGPQYSVHQCTLSLPKLLGLPGTDSTRELTDYQSFLHWIEARRTQQTEPTVQWFRGGYGSRGLEWVGLKELGLTEEQKKQWNQDLQDWRKVPWFEEFYKKTMDGLARLRVGPHCWFRIAHLRKPQIMPAPSNSRGAGLR